MPDVTITSSYSPWSFTSTARESASGSGLSLENNYAVYWLRRRGMDDRQAYVDNRRHMSAGVDRYAFGLELLESEIQLVVHAFKLCHQAIVHYSNSVFVKDVFTPLPADMWEGEWGSGPSDESWLVPSWESWCGGFEISETELLEFRREILVVANRFGAGKPLIPSAELQALAEDAAKQCQQRANEDIGEWARRLANEISNATD